MATVTISGNVGQAGATVWYYAFSGPTGTTADALGNYSFSWNPASSLQIAVTYPGVIFTPHRVQIGSGMGNTTQNFASEAAPTIVFSTPLVTDDFTPDANPLNPANWYTSPTGNFGSWQTPKASGGYLVTGTTSDFSDFSLNLQVLPNDQYVSYKWHQVPNVTFQIVARSDIEGNSNFVYSEYNAISNNISIAQFAGGVKNLVGLTLSDGDIVALACVGTNAYVFVNGAFYVWAPVLPASGYAGVVPKNFSGVSSQTTHFTAGAASFAGATGNNSAAVGQFYGTTFESAFTNPESLDVLQVVNQGGEVVWNLTFNGVGSNNPISPTNGALFTYFGSSFVQAFNPNPSKLDVLQVAQPGGKVIFSVDYKGNAGSH